VADRDGANQCAPPLDVPSMEGLGHSLMAPLNAALRATPLGVNLLSICPSPDNQFEYAPRREATIALTGLGYLRRCKRREADAFKRRETDLRWVLGVAASSSVLRENKRKRARQAAEGRSALRYLHWERDAAREQEKASTRGLSKAVVHVGN